jgi:S-adenosylmethionine-diacylglycerol 3-amino-3-carboxypropyl transferase
MPNGGRLAFWNLFVPRESPISQRDRIRPLPRLSRALARRDRAWFYSAFHVEEVLAR